MTAVAVMGNVTVNVVEIATPRAALQVVVKAVAKVVVPALKAIPKEAVKLGATVDAEAGVVVEAGVAVTTARVSRKDKARI